MLDESDDRCADGGEDGDDGARRVGREEDNARSSPPASPPASPGALLGRVPDATTPAQSDPTSDESSMGEALPSALDVPPSAPPPSPLSPPPHIPTAPPPSPPPPSSPPPPPMQPLADDPRALLSLLCCPLCPPQTLLHAPVTLHCGHTVCAAHLRSAPSLPHTPTPASPRSTPPLPSDDWAAPCPIPTCSRPSPQEAPTFIHPDAHVGLIRPPVLAAASAPSTPPAGAPQHSHVDVKVNKVLELVRRAVDAGAQPEWSRPRRGFAPADEDERTDESDAGESENDDERDEEDDDDARAGPSSRPRPAPHSPRPRKRRRLRHIPRPASRPPRRAPDAAGDTRFEKELRAELACEICFALMWQPVTTPCQHTFCSKCLQRALDHTNTCPLCREKLPGYVYFQEHSCNKLVLSIILKTYPEAYAERGATIQAEERNARLNTPIFEIQLSFPGMPTILHFYEPRYRLMLRRCLATPHPCFGMIPQRPATAAETGAYEYGTMLEIRNVQMLPDGRSVVETWGSYRFRIMERGVLDGYVVGRIERVDDYDEEIGRDGGEAAQAQSEPDGELAAGAGEKPEGEGGDVFAGTVSAPHPGPAVPTNQELIQICRDFVQELKDGTPWVNQQISTNYVPMPSDLSAFGWWIAPLIPIEEKDKAKLLPIRSPRLRLRLIVHWIEQLKSHWARSYASASPWQVVRYWLYALLMPWAVPLPVRWAMAPRRRAAQWAARVLVFVAVVGAQVWIYREQQRERAQRVAGGEGG